MSAASPVDIVRNPNDAAQRAVAWGTGRIDSYGGAPPIATGAPWADRLDQPVVVAIHVTDWSADTLVGYLLDFQGGVQPFGGAPALMIDHDSNSSTQAQVPGVPYVGERRYVDWSWDPAGTGQAYVLDHYGEIFPMGGATPPPRTGRRWGDPVARKLQVDWGPTRRALTMDYSGGLHSDFAATSVGSTTGYFPGRDAARDFVVTSWGATTQGYILDGQGGVHSFGGAPAAYGGPYNASADVARALLVLSASDPMRFLQVWSGGEQIEWVASTPPTVRAGGGVDEVQRVTISGAPTGGTFTLTRAGQTTAAIPRTATAAQLDAAIEALPNVGAGNVSTAGAFPTWTVTFTGALAATDVPQMTATSSLTGGTSPAIAVTTLTGGITTTPPSVVTTTTRPVLSWTYSDPQQDSQAAYEWFVFTQAFVDTHTMTDPAVHAASAVASGSGINRTVRAVTTPVDLANGSYRFYVRAKDTAGQWSNQGGAWSALGWTQSVPLPTTPTGMTATPDDDTMTVALSAVGTVGGVANLMRFEYSDDPPAVADADATWVAVLGADAVPLAASTTATDEDPPLGPSRRYRAISYAVEPRVASVPSNVDTAAVSRRTYALTAVEDRTVGGEVLLIGSMGWTREADAGVFQGLGAKYPVVVEDGDEPKARRQPLTIDTGDRAAWELVAGVLRTPGTKVFRDPFGDVMYCRIVGTISRDQQREMPLPGELTPLRHSHVVQLTLVEVEPPNVGL